MNNDKKGQSLSINTIIITILAIFVLVIVVVALTGGSGNFFENIGAIFGASAIDTNKFVLKCQGWCTDYENTGSDSYRVNFCEKETKVDSDGDGEADTTLICSNLVSQGKLSCSAIQC